MRKFVLLAASLALAAGTAIAAEKADVKQAPKVAVKMTDAQMAKTAAGDSNGVFVNGSGKTKSANSCSWSKNGSGAYWWFCY